MKAYCDSISNQPKRVVGQLADTAASLPPAAAFSEFVTINDSLQRISALIMFDPISFTGQCKNLFGALTPAIAGFVGEQLLSHLREGVHRVEVANVMLEIGEGILRIYTASEFPVRRLRYALPVSIQGLCSRVAD